MKSGIRLFRYSLSAIAFLKTGQSRTIADHPDSAPNKLTGLTCKTAACGTSSAGSDRGSDRRKQLLSLDEQGAGSKWKGPGIATA